MSTNGSDTSSHIRQFGLYRTIDAKTEEFLKLSKKRQIKQGCACAAISTVITVAVVIIVIIIYEYSTISNTKTKSNLRKNWLSLMNNSLEEMPFEIKFDKAKINPGTIQILPLILKTIKKNVYFDKIIEDSVNSSTSYDKKDSTESVSYKNTPTSSKNWVRFPVSKLYTIEYKTSPIFYFKNPTKNIEYFTKIRKIRDYQRVMNYVDKMISDKVSLGTTIPMAKYIYNAYRIPNIEYTTPMPKRKKGDEKYKNIKKKQVTPSHTQTKITQCSCKESVRDLLSKFITNLKELLPSVTDKASKASTMCKIHHPSKEVKVTDKGVQATIHLCNDSLHKTTKELSEQNPYISKKYLTHDEKPHYERKFVKPNGITNNTSQKLYNSYKTIVTKQKLTDSYKTINSNEQQTIRDIEDNTIQNKEQTTFSELRTDDEIYNTTESNIIDYFKLLDAHSLALVKRKMIPGRNKTELSKNKSDENILLNLFSSPSPTYNISESGSEAILVNSNLNISETNDSEYINIPTIDTIAQNGFVDTTVHSLITDTTTLGNVVTEYSYNSSTMRDNMLHFDDITVEEEMNKASTDNPEISIKKLENMIKKLNNSTIYSNTNKSSEYEWELVNVVEDKYDEDITNSMIPQSRSSYLEIQRNEWKNDEQQDYDNNLNNYLLD